MGYGIKKVWGDDESNNDPQWVVKKTKNQKKLEKLENNIYVMKMDIDTIKFNYSFESKKLKKKYRKKLKEQMKDDISNIKKKLKKEKKKLKQFKKCIKLMK